MPPGPGLEPGGQPPGLPPALLAPSSRPDEPVSTPLSPGPAPIPETNPEQRIMLLQAITSNQELSREFREWAQLLLDSLIRAD